MAESNYGAEFTKGGATIGKCIVQDYPELSTEKIPSTNHGSGGKAEYVPSKLIDAGDITLSVIVETGTLIAMEADMAAQTVEECVITDDVDIFTFDGFYQSIKKEAADAQTPDIMKVTVVLAVTGGVAITAPAP